MHTPDLTQDHINRIRELFPNCVTESRDENGKLKLAVDFDQLKQELSDSIVEGLQERYHLNWPGKREALLTANAPIAKTLRPCREESVDFDTTKNLFIEGDNLEALKLLQETYLGKVKMIYIDPPYNTGSDFIYEDDFADGTNEFFLKSNQKDEKGNRLVANTESNGRFHSDWLSMMYSRLRLAKNLLEDDGVIFISIDDSEQDNLKKICNEIFGEENFINTVSVNIKNIAGASGGGEDKKLKKNIEYIHIYTKNYAVFPSFENAYDYIPIADLVQKYRDEEKSWKYTSILKYEGDKNYIGSTVDGEGNEIKIFSRKNPIIKSVNQIMKEDGLDEAEVYRRYAKRTFQTAMPQSSIRPRVMQKVHEIGTNEELYSIEYTPRSGRNKGNVYEQFYKGDSFRLFAWLGDVAEELDGVLYKKELQGTFWDFVGETKNLAKEGDVSFPNGKKPIALLNRLLRLMGDRNAVVLDFFAGSASTAHAVLQANSDDGGERKFIMIQIPEECDDKSESYKEGYRTIAEIGKERIRRAGKKIVEGKCHENWNKDIGFRVLKINTSNMAEVYYTPDGVKQNDLLAAVDNIRPDRSPEDLLFQVLLDWGVDLTLPIVKKTVQGKTVFFVDGNALVACFDMGITEELVKELAVAKPLRLVFRDNGFVSDAVKINAEQIFKQISPGTDMKSI